MKRLCKLLSIIPVIASVVHMPATGDDDPVASATVPLAEVLRLYEENAEAKMPADEKPPVSASVERIDLSGRLLEDGVDITAHFEVSVLCDSKWACVPLLAEDETISITEVPKLEGAVITEKDRDLCLVTQKSGRYAVDISMIKWAGREGKRRSAEISFGRAAMAQLDLRYDEGLFHVRGEHLVRKPDGVVVYPHDNRFSITWEQRRASAATKAEPVKRPPIESMVSSAHATSVSTLEGRLITRVLYKLRFEGAKTISFEIPDCCILERVYRNGTAIPFEAGEGSVAVEVIPSRAGDQTGSVELVMIRQLGNYLLSGSLEFYAPKVSWPVHETFWDLYLSDVFNFSRGGGSMASTTTAPEVSYTYNIPLPGKKLSFHQYLVTSSAPTVRVDYSIDLAGKYFTIQ